MKATSFDAASSFASPATSRHVLVVESDPDQRRRVLAQLTQWGYSPLDAGSAEEALELLGRTRVAFSLVAIRLPGMSGIELVRRAPELAESGPVIMIADAGHSAQIVEAIQAGADDFLPKPFTTDDVENVIKSALARPRRSWDRLPDDEARTRLHEEVGLWRSPKMSEVRDIIAQAACVDVTVLICGETGTGKDVVARAIHDAIARGRTGRT